MVEDSVEVVGLCDKVLGDEKALSIPRKAWEAATCALANSPTHGHLLMRRQTKITLRYRVAINNILRNVIALTFLFAFI